MNPYMEIVGYSLKPVNSISACAELSELTMPLLNFKTDCQCPCIFVLVKTSLVPKDMWVCWLFLSSFLIQCSSMALSVD